LIDLEHLRFLASLPTGLCCNKGLGRAYWAYTQPCEVLKDMGDGRLKVRTWGYQTAWYYPESRIRYVAKNQVGSFDWKAMIEEKGFAI
jgi:hypothetical protein